MTLTARKQRFVEEYVVDLNATQAAIRAGYSARTANRAGSRLLSDVDVSKALATQQAKLAARTEITAERVVNELARIAFGKLSDVTDWGMKEVAIGFDADGRKLRPEEIGDAAVVQYVEAPFVTPINRDDLPQDVRAAVAEVALTKDGFRVKMHDKVAALAKLGQHLGLFAETHRHLLLGAGDLSLKVEFVSGGDGADDE